MRREKQQDSTITRACRRRTRKKERPELADAVTAMSEPGILLSRTLASAMNELQGQQILQEQLAPPSPSVRKTSIWLSIRLYLRSKTAVGKPQTLLQYLNIGVADFGFSMFLGSMLPISIYVCLLALTGGDVVRASLRPEGALSGASEGGLPGTTVKALVQSPYRWNNGLFGGDVRLHEGWDGIPSAESVDSEMVVSFDNDLEGKNGLFSLEAIEGIHGLTISRT